MSSESEYSNIIDSALGEIGIDNFNLNNDYRSSQPDYGLTNKIVSISTILIRFVLTFELHFNCV